MKCRTITCAVVGVLVATWWLLPTPALGQSTQPATIHTGFASNNVSGSVIAAGRPGAWLQASSNLPSHKRRGLLELPTITAQKEPSIKDEVLPQIVDIFLAAINALAAAINTVITGAIGT